MKHYTKPCPKTMKPIKKLSQDLSWITNDVFDSAIWSRIVQDKINEIIDRINNLDDRKKK